MIGKIFPRASMIILVWALLGASTFGQDKVKFSTTLKTQPLYFLPILAAEEKGIWKNEGLKVEWIPFHSSETQFRAVAARAVSTGIAPATSNIISTARGVAAAILADLGGFQRWGVWVRYGAAIKDAKDLKAARINVARFGGLMHAYGLALARALGMEKELKFVASGGVPQGVAALKAGVVDATISTPFIMTMLEHEGVTRRLFFLADYIPADQDPLVIFATIDFAKASPDLLRRLVRGVVRAAAAAVDNPPWSIEKMKEETRWPPAVAAAVFKHVNYSRDGRIQPERLATLREFLIEYGLAPKEKMPPVEQLYLLGFAPG